MTDSHSKPTPIQQDHATLVHAEIVEAANRLIAEGIDWRIVLAGMGAATADIVSSRMGGGEVPLWFAKMTARTWHMADPKG